MKLTVHVGSHGPLESRHHVPSNDVLAMGIVVAVARSSNLDMITRAVGRRFGGATTPRSGEDLDAEKIHCHRDAFHVTQQGLYQRILAQLRCQLKVT
ncbi:MAG: hypothetical protein M3O26_16570 [Pseudomonadota bacterium]|nr:hypothetical protein [Pseudomonadota bacterium]